MSNEFQWTFHENFIWSTLFFCHFYWRMKDTRFDVFNKTVREQCDGGDSICYWLVKEDGFYFAANAANPSPYDLRYANSW